MINMTLQEAFEKYEREVEQKIESHENKIKKSIIVGSIIALISIIVFSIMLIIGYNLPLEEVYFSTSKERSIGAFFLIVYGWIFLVLTPIIYFIYLPSLFARIKKGPRLAQLFLYHRLMPKFFHFSWRCIIFFSKHS